MRVTGFVVLTAVDLSFQHEDGVDPATASKAIGKITGEILRRACAARAAGHDPPYLAVSSAARSHQILCFRQLDEVAQRFLPDRIGHSSRGVINDGNRLFRKRAIITLTERPARLGAQIAGVGALAVQAARARYGIQRVMDAIKMRPCIADRMGRRRSS